MNGKAINNGDEALPKSMRGTEKGRQGNVKNFAFRVDFSGASFLLLLTCQKQ